MGAHDKTSRHENLNSEEETKNLNRDIMCFQAKNKGSNQENWNST